MQRKYERGHQLRRLLWIYQGEVISPQKLVIHFVSRCSLARRRAGSDAGACLLQLSPNSPPLVLGLFLCTGTARPHSSAPPPPPTTKNRQRPPQATTPV